MSNKSKEKDSNEIVRRIGTMNTEKYLQEAPVRTSMTPNKIGTDYQVMQIAKGMGRHIFNNPMELANSLQGFEDFCIEKNLSPSFIALSIYLNISKSTLLKYFKDETEYLVYVVVDNLTNNYIYSNIDKVEFDKYISSTYESINNNTIIENNSNNSNSNNNKNVLSIKEKIDKGIYKVIQRTITFADVLAPMRSLIELTVTNKGFTMKNPAFAIFIAKNRFGETTQYSDRQEIAVQATNPIDDMDDEQILKVAESLPDDE